MQEDPAFLHSQEPAESLDDVRNKTLEKALKLSKILSGTDYDLRTVTSLGYLFLTIITG